MDSPSVGDDNGLWSRQYAPLLARRDARLRLRHPSRFSKVRKDRHEEATSGQRTTLPDGRRHFSKELRGKVKAAVFSLKKGLAEEGCRDADDFGDDGLALSA